jgi:putative transposase
VAAVLRAAALVVALAEAGPEPEGRPAGPPRSRPPRRHRDHVEPTVADRQSPTGSLRRGCPTEHWTDEGKLYLCAIKVVCSHQIVGYSIDSRITAQLAVAALRNAVALREPTNTTLHSDRGSQFRSRKFVEQLKEFGIIESMGRVGACTDNAGMESLSSLLQKNVMNRQRWRTRQELRLAIVTWIERTSHRRRRQRRLGRLTPIEFEIINAQAAHVA